MLLVLRKYQQMNKFTENECLPNFELKLRKCIEEKTKMAETREDERRKPNDSSCRRKPNKRRERKPNRYQCRKESSIYSGKPNHCNLYNG